MTTAGSPTCDYCCRPTVLVHGRDLYPHLEHLADKPFYYCEPCVAWVGCHYGTTEPLGRLANAELRKAKGNAHNAFDRIWKGPAATMSRSEAYLWLSERLGIPLTDCHIGKFDVELCRRTARIVKEQKLLPPGPRP